MALVRPVANRVRQSSGQRDRLVAIEQLTERIGASGLPIESWEPLASEWMAKQDFDQSEDFRAGQLTSPLRSDFEMPYRADMDPETVDVVKLRRLVYGGRVFDITEATQIGYRAGIEVITLAKVG